MYARMARFATRLARPMSRLARRLPRAFRRARPVRRFKKTQNKVHSFIRWGDKDTSYGIYGPNAIAEQTFDQHLSYQFSLSNVVNPSDFTSLYDMYKINKITLHLEPTRTSTGLISNTGSLHYTNKKLRIVHDYNDGDLLTQEDDYLEYSNCKSYSALRNIVITLYPKLNNKIEDVNDGDAFTSVNSNKVWLRTASTTVPHFGLKVFIPAEISNVNEAPLFKVRAKFHISLKNSK